MKRLLIIAALVLIGAGCETTAYPTGNPSIERTEMTGNISCFTTFGEGISCVKN